MEGSRGSDLDQVDEGALILTKKDVKLNRPRRKIFQFNESPRPMTSDDYEATTEPGCQREGGSKISGSALPWQGQLSSSKRTTISDRRITIGM